MRKSKPQTSSFCGVRTRVKPTQSSFITSSKAFATAPRMYAVDPRRTTSAKFADVWLGIDVGSDIALANTIGREIIAAGLTNEAFIAHSTMDFDAYKASSKNGRSNAAQQLPAYPPKRSNSWPTTTPKPKRRRSAGRLGSPNTTTAPTTCCPSSTCRC